MAISQSKGSFTLDRMWHIMVHCHDAHPCRAVEMVVATALDL